MPDDEQLDDAIKAGLKDVKVQEGHDPNKIKYKLAVPIDLEWIKQVDG